MRLAELTPPLRTLRLCSGTASKLEPPERFEEERIGSPPSLPKVGLVSLFGPGPRPNHSGQWSQKGAPVAAATTRALP